MAERTVDCDVHVAPPTIEELGPYLSEHWRAFSAETSFKQPTGIAYTYPPWLAPLAIPRSDLATLQVDLLDRVSSAIVNCYYGVESILHPFLARDLTTALNDWLQGEWLARDERLLASALITPHVTEFAVDEIQRIAREERFVQVLLPARAQEPYGNRRYWPIWEAAAEHDLVVGLTFGGAAGSPNSPVGWLGSYFEEYTLAHIPFQNHITSMIIGGVFDRYPTLKLSVLESGWTWLPSLLWRMDTEWKAVRRETPWVQELPSAYVRRHVRFATQPIDAPPTPEQLDQVLEELASDELLIYGSDYPRTYEPGIGALLERLTPEQTERVLWRNATDWYGLATAVPAA